MGRYITTKTDFTLRRKHKTGSGATIYENNYTTINPMPNALKGEYVIGDSNFVFTSRLGINAQKKHVRGKFVINPSGSTDERGAWTIDTMIDSGITEETRIRLKPNYSSIRDFACYGSAVKLVQGTVNGVITDFPAEMWLSDEDLKVYQGDAGYSFDETNPTAFTEKILYNEYNIDITSVNIRPESVYNPLRFFTLCGSSYTYIDDGGEEHDFTDFTVEQTSSGYCSNGKEVWVDQLAKVTLNFEGASVTVRVLKDTREGDLYYTYTGGGSGCHIRPKKEIVEQYFRDCDDFTAVLLDRYVKPIYTATFETPKETETGYSYDMVTYTWPTLLGGYNPDLSGPYYSYLGALIDLGEYYDEYHTDNIWRSLTHEAIKTLDWTYVSNTDGDVEDMSTIDTSRIEPITKIYGRQFDDLKRYADAIKSINTITYDQKSNSPDYTLTDILENSGWETSTLKITSDNDIATVSLYSGLTSGYTASDANNEFMRRLKLNSNYLFSVKGTRKGLDAMLGMFGFTPEDYDIHEYVYVFKGGEYGHFCNDTDGKSFPYPLAKDVTTINKYKINFDTLDPYGDYCGIPVAEIGYEKDGEDYSYCVPWFSYGKKYDDGLYFQMNGGWGRRESMDVELEIASGVSSITEWAGVVPLYMETQARLKFAKDFDELLQQAFSDSKYHDVFYVTDISKMEELYEKNGEDLSEASHYFVLENVELNQFLGYSNEYTGETHYGWRSIQNDEIQDPDTFSAGTLVLYLESIRDNTTGNNPHIGGGTYDDGMGYVSGMSEIFGYSLVNKNFIGIDDDTCDKIKEYKFEVEKQEDNRKCWFFSDDYNKRCTKEQAYSASSECNTEGNIEFREVDVSDYICDLKNCNDSSTGNSDCNDSLFYDVAELLGSAKVNATLDIGEAANEKGHFSSGAMETYGRESSLSAYDPEIDESGKNGEGAANSIVNVKNIELHFTIPSDFEDEDKKAFRQYIESSVLPYLTQMIPSTAILGIYFDDGGGEHSNPTTQTTTVSGNFEQSNA